MPTKVSRKALTAYLIDEIESMQKRLDDLHSTRYPSSPMMADALKDSRCIIPAMIGYKVQALYTVAERFGIYIKL